MSTNNDILTAVKQGVDILDVARNSTRFTLKDAGNGRFVSPCPFHDEKEPSLYIYTDRQQFTCFGCQKKGDVIDLYQELTGTSMKEALSQLATQYNIKTRSSSTPYKPTQQEIDAKLYRTMNWVSANHYTKMFWEEGNSGYLYMSKERGFKDEILKSFGIGFAPSSPRGLMNALKQAKITEAFALRHGLLVKSKKNGNNYNPLFERIVFPVQVQGKGTIAFGGRDISNSNSAKYKNSSTNEFFTKGSVLYGLVQACPDIRNSKSAIIVEGYMDVLAMHQASFTNTVGSMGTALTTDQLKNLYEYTQNVTLLFDGDNAGHKAAIGACKKALECGFNVRVALLDEGTDPDDYLSSNGEESMKKVLNDAVDGVKFLLDALEAESVTTMSDWISVFVNSFKNKLHSVIWANKIAFYLGVATKDLLTTIGFEYVPIVSEESAIIELEKHH